MGFVQERQRQIGISLLVDVYVVVLTAHDNLVVVTVAILRRTAVMSVVTMVVEVPMRLPLLVDVDVVLVAGDDDIVIMLAVVAVATRFRLG